MSHIFSAGHRCPAKTNPKSETRNPKRALNSNEKFSKPDQSARPRRLGFADLLLCSLEFVSDFGFRISDFGFCPIMPHLRSLATGLAAAILFAACSRQDNPAQQQRGKGMAVPVTVAVAAQRDVPIQLQAIGAARAYASVSVKARVDGQLARVSFKQGDEVKKEDLIF